MLWLTLKLKSYGDRADSSSLPELDQDLEPWYQQRSRVPICLFGESSFPGSSVVRNLPAVQETQETWVRSLGQEDPVEEAMTTLSSILAGKISWTEEPGRLQFMGLQSQTWLSDWAWTHWRLKSGQLCCHSWGFSLLWQSVEVMSVGILLHKLHAF